jgi:diguanylate cyclase (GGDEF)-like protein
MRLLRLSPLLLIGTHLVARLLLGETSKATDLYLYNAVIVFIVLIAARAPIFNDHFSIAFLITAILLWGAGSIASSISAFYIFNSDLIAPICYSLLYPAAFIALPRILVQRAEMRTVEILDSAIIGLGLSSLGAALFIAPVLPSFEGDAYKSFFAILYPIGDLVLVVSVLATLAIRKPTPRGLIVLAGVLLFAASDFLYLWLHVHNRYQFGSLTDDGWLISFAVLVQALYLRPRDEVTSDTAHPVFVALSIFLSATLLGALSLRPGYFPTFILFPTIATLLLAFIRMTIALREARGIGKERILARTDDLTGLANRRRLISDLQTFSQVEGALLLLDLDGFKPVNDEHGHEVGDQILQQVAIRFSRALPSDALLARLGGDEFGVILHGSVQSAMEIALALRATMSYPFLIGSIPISVGVSIGVAENDGSQDLLRQADVAMYQAKTARLGVAAYRP